MPIRAVSETVSINNIVPYFQPIMDLRSNRVWRYECLARLITAEDKTFLPSEFLYLIEREQHVKALTEAMFSQSARYFRHVQVPWSINISARDLLNENLTTTLLSHLIDYPNPKRVSIEISAASALTHPELMQAFVERCAEAGLGVFLDNVGENPGNINAILNMQIKGIKLAGGLISHYEQDDAVQDYVDNLLALCKARAISVVAEHIETDLLLESVNKLPIQYAQGYVFSPPQPTTPITRRR
ncbi:EAL domain-containing protein [Alteromonas stellipolaris]|uniref:EAL domain-containing protein n=1 Tax=Alteromonas stellipolaris TaxID=233316 RepID=UPI0007B4458A|nr:EAL domain-containing protein [Alteromonas stellipolaris]ANB25141.1 EAL domain-containing protein [Alteromonas stellipolaris]